MDKSEFDAAWKDIGPRAQRMLKDFAKYPTDRNQSYATGYLAAMFDNSVIRQNSYTFLLALVGQLPTTMGIIEAIKEAG